MKRVDRVLEHAMAEGLLSGAVVLITHRGAVVKHRAYGKAYQYTDDQFTLADKPIEMAKDTIFDVASISKVFTSTAVLKLQEAGLLDVNDPVARYIPEFRAQGKGAVTLRQLLTHTSGFTASIPLYEKEASREERVQHVFSYPLEHPPGQVYTYSDLNMIVLGALVERMTGKRLDEYVKETITEPLGMKDTMYNPPAERKTRTAATEYQAELGRGLVWGVVHDENAWALEGVAGHAGVFSTAHDLAVFSHMMLGAGQYDGICILQPKTVKLLTENQIPDFPQHSHGLGWEVDQGWYMNRGLGPETYGHTGFTGTSLVVSPRCQTVIVLLTNRVHPSRHRGAIHLIRQQVAQEVADIIS